MLGLVDELELVPDGRDVVAPLRHAGWSGAPVKRMLTVIWRRSSRRRQVKFEVPKNSRPSTRSRHSNSSRPTVTGPATASSSPQVIGPTTPSTSMGGVREAWNSRTALSGLAAEVAVHVEQRGHLVRRDRVELLLELLDGGALRALLDRGWVVPFSGVPRGAASVGPSTVSRPWRVTRGASSSSLAHVSSPATPSGTSGGLVVWNTMSAAVVSGPKMAVMRSGGTAAPTALSACWSSPTSTLGPSPWRRISWLSSAPGAGAGSVAVRPRLPPGAAPRARRRARARPPPAPVASA